MEWKDDCERRTFLKVSGMAALGAAFGTWGFRARAELSPATIRIGHITDTFFTRGDDPDKSGRLHPGWLYGDAYEIADDLLAQFEGAGEGPVQLILHSGNLLRSGMGKKTDKRASAFEDWSKKSPIPFKVCGMGEEGKNYFSHDMGGFHFIQLGTRGHAGRLIDREKQIEWLSCDLADHASAPTVLVLHPPLIDTDKGYGLNRNDREAVIDLIRKNHQVLLALCGKALANKAGFISKTDCLCLVTASPVIYPCGARLVDMSVENSGAVTIRSRFLQTRRLELVEKSFHQAGPPRLLKNLGTREDRSFTARGGSREIKPFLHKLNPCLAPWWKSEDSVTLAVLADTHVCLDKFVSDEALESYETIGHFTEAGSRAIFDDVLSQVASGRHRVEFYDEVFSRDPDSEAHYLEQTVDALLIAGDFTEHGAREEVEVMKDGLAGLPKPIRERTLLAIGNHDMWFKDYAPNGSASGRDLISEAYKGYGITEGRTHYVVALTDWLYLIVLDSVVATFGEMGLIQEQIDWLEDQLESLRDKAVLVASHHPLYHLTLVPPAMYAYLRARSHFTPPRSAARVQLHELFARHSNVKMVISGHYHSVVVDQHKKLKRNGKAPDDGFTTHIQIPCTVEYPCGYRLLKISRNGNRGRIEYINAYSRLADLRAESSQARIFKILGTGVRPPRRYEGTLARLKEQDNILGLAAALNPYDIADLNVRGLKDGTANNGRGNTGKPNINGKIEFGVRS